MLVITCYYHYKSANMDLRVFRKGLNLLMIILHSLEMVECNSGLFHFEPESIWRGTVKNLHFKGDPVLCADRNWNFNSANIVCRTLGFTGAMFYKALTNTVNPAEEPAVDCQFNSVTDIPCRLNNECQEIAWAACQLPGYEGCHSGEAFSEYIRYPVPGALTIEKCLEGCRDSSEMTYRYAALSVGRNCYCSNVLPRSSLSRADSNCDAACQGDTGQACGGSSGTHSAIYNTILGSCEASVTSDAGYITSPGFPGEAPSGMSCRWHFGTNFYNRTLITVVGAELEGGNRLGVNFNAVTIHKITFETGEASYTIEREDSNLGDQIWRTDTPIEKIAEENTYRENLTITYSTSNSNAQWFVLKFQVAKVDFEMPTTTSTPPTTPNGSLQISWTSSLVMVILAAVIHHSVRG